MKVDGFQIKIHGFFALLIAIAVFTAAYKVGQMGVLNSLPIFGKTGGQQG